MEVNKPFTNVPIADKRELCTSDKINIPVPVEAGVNVLSSAYSLAILFSHACSLFWVDIITHIPKNVITNVPVESWGKLQEIGKGRNVVLINR